MRHVFVVENIQRGESKSEVELKWNGKSLNVDKQDAQKVEIPEKTDSTIHVAFSFDAGKVFVFSVLLVAPLVLGDSLLLTQPVAVMCRLEPSHGNHWRIIA